MKYFLLILRVLAALILLQTLYFKFTAHPESVFIFETVGLEPAGRILVGIFELVAAILLLIPRTVIYGSLLSIGIISGAIFLHLTSLGIEVNNDGGYLFILAVVVFLSSLVLSIANRKKIPFIGSKF